MARLASTPPAIVILGPGALSTARSVQSVFPGAQVHALSTRVQADVPFTELARHLGELYAQGVPIIALCAAGIVIRCLAPLLANKGNEPPVLAVAEDGSAVVPLLGGLAGVNSMARQIATALNVAPAITTSGELRFGACLLNPPDGYALADIDQGKRFVSDLLAGADTRLEGDMPWLRAVDLPEHAQARHAIRLTPQRWHGAADELVIHPRCVLAAVTALDEIEAQIRSALAAQDLSPLALAALLAPAHWMGVTELADAAAALKVPLRFVDAESTTAAALFAGSPVQIHGTLGIAETALDITHIGRARGVLSVLGLGPGRADLLTPAAHTALREATDILGYATYTAMAGPFRADQTVHATDNREELQRARHAFELAAQGRRVAMVSSGDPGVFAMATATLEALDQSGNPDWARVDLRIIPGVSAALATAAEAGAPLGHDFCMLSLSDNLKPWRIIESRLRHAAEADLVMAFYNPVSRARPWQLDRALDVVREYRKPETVVVLGRDIGRPGGALVTTTLGALRSEQVDSRTMVIIGSTHTRVMGLGGEALGVGVSGHGGGGWVYTPRWYHG